MSTGYRPPATFDEWVKYGQQNLQSLLGQAGPAARQLAGQAGQAVGQAGQAFGQALSPYWPGGPSNAWQGFPQQQAQSPYGAQQPQAAGNPYQGATLSWQAPAPPAVKPDPAAAQAGPAQAAPAAAGAQPAAATTAATQATGTRPAAANGGFGYSYGVAPGYNAWALYNGGTNDGGWYNPGSDLLSWDAGRGNGQTENSRDRVLRWTLDQLRQAGLDPGSAPLDTVNQYFMQNVARLHRDIDQTPGLGPQQWARSGFQGFDQLAQGAAQGAGQPGPGQPGQPGQPAPAPAATGGQPAPTGAAPAASPAAAAGGGNAATGGQPWNAAYLDFLNNHPEAQDIAILQGLGYNTTRPGIFGQSALDNLRGQVSAMLQFGQYIPGSASADGGGVNPTGMGNVVQGLLSGYRQPGNDAYANVRGMARGIAGNAQFQSDLGAEQSDQNQYKNLQNLQAMGLAGSAGLAQSAAQGRLGQSYVGFLQNGMGQVLGGQAAPMSYYDWLLRPGGSGMNGFGF